jgi:hypothetical protein
MTNRIDNLKVREKARLLPLCYRTKPFSVAVIPSATGTLNLAA